MNITFTIGFFYRDCRVSCGGMVTQIHKDHKLIGTTTAKDNAEIKRYIDRLLEEWEK